MNFSPLCEACERRPATGRSVHGHIICRRCAGDVEYLQELEASKQRTEPRRAALSQQIRLASSRIQDATPLRELARRHRVSVVAKASNAKRRPRDG